MVTFGFVLLLKIASCGCKLLKIKFSQIANELEPSIPTTLAQIFSLTFNFSKKKKCITTQTVPTTNGKDLAECWIMKAKITWKFLD